MIDMKKIKENKRTKRQGIFYQNTDTGYQGILYGYHSMSILDADGQEVMHVGRCSIDTLEDLKKEVDNFPAFLKILQGLENTLPKREADPDKLENNKKIISDLRRNIRDE